MRLPDFSTVRTYLTGMFRPGRENPVSPTQQIPGDGSSPFQLDPRISVGGPANPVAEAQMTKAWNAYYGYPPRTLKSDHPNAVDDNVVVNWHRMIVDKGSTFLFGKDFGFEGDEDCPDDVSQWIQDLWQHNAQGSFLQKLAINGGVAGHAFIKIIPDDPFPRLVLLNPSMVAVQWAPDDIGVVTAYVIQYSVTQQSSGKAINIRQVIEDQQDGTWLITDEEKQPQATAWTMIDQQVWPWPFAPILDCQNLPNPNEYWGLPDLTDDLLQLGHRASFVLSNLNRINRLYAHPRPWGRGIHQTQVSHVDVQPGRVLMLPGEKAELHNLDMQADIAGGLALYGEIKDAYFEQARVPQIALGKLDAVGVLSGLAMQIMYQPLISKTESKRRLYGDLLEELNRRLLVVGGKPDASIIIHWPEMLPNDPQDVAQTSLLYQQLGVSDDTILQRLGFDPELEARKCEEQAQRKAKLGQLAMQAFDRSGALALPARGEQDETGDDNSRIVVPR